MTTDDGRQTAQYADIADQLLSALVYNEAGLIPAIVQDASTRQVLMMAWMNAESLRRTLEIGETVFWSRSRQEFWHKGATSGNTQRVVELRADCDGDTLLVLVAPAGPACHTGAVSCFFQEISIG
ncbi:MAG: phosphoribosyl-AMP cyclohydrolase [Caldilineaceae bacterium]|nr:phosphoribosyl-AMP cyclohydrolase [Caldilineaceae bacterium]